MIKMVTIIKKGLSREKIRLALKKRIVKINGPDLKKYCGCITMVDDPLMLQKQWRNEWE